MRLISGLLLLTLATCTPTGGASVMVGPDGTKTSTQVGVVLG